MYTINTSHTSLYNPQQEHDACGVGFVGNMDNVPQHRVVEYALHAMSCLAHRGGQEDDEKMSDGSGLLTPIPKEFFSKIFPMIAESTAQWGIGSFFLPYDSFLNECLHECIKNSAKACGFHVEQYREVPTDINILSRKVLATLPEFTHILFVADKSDITTENREQHLYILRKHIEFAAIGILKKYATDLSAFHIASLSAQSIVYKGILPGKNLGAFYPDLLHEDFKAPFAIFHERFSTNTKPSWHLTQPFRHIAHNGEINTIRGNMMHMGIREAALHSSALGEHLPKLLPCIHPSTSDSGAFDNVLELLMHGGYGMEHAISTMIPEPTGMAQHHALDQKKHAFYAHHERLMEPWDGPTTMIFTDGHSKVGATLDRNGLRPCRYSITEDNLIILSSEAGVLDAMLDDTGTACAPRMEGQLAPRTLLVVDFAQHRILYDDEIKENLCALADFSTILQEQRIHISTEDAPAHEAMLEHAKYVDLFGYGEKAPESMLMSMVQTKEEPVGAMGLDEPLAVLSSKPQSLFNYFKQLFAQVTNPSIDPIREKFSMSLHSTLGGKGNLFQSAEEHAPYFFLENPFVFQKNIDEIRTNAAVQCQSISINLPLHAGFNGFCTTLESVCLAAQKAVYEGARVLVLSDKELTKDTMPLPVLLTIAAVHQELVRKNLRHACDIVVETGQAFEVMHMALLLSFGANAIYPYAAHAAIANMVQKNAKKLEYNTQTAIHRYCEALSKGLLKVFARLGVSTLASFIGSKAFECVGLSPHVVETYFTNTLSRIGGIDLEHIYTEHYERFMSFVIKTHGVSKSDKHIWTKEICSILRTSVTENSYHFFELYTKQLNKQEEDITLRSVWQFKHTHALDIEDVEDIHAIRQRFFAAPMSLGALSQESHECIAAAFNNLGLMSNCGEGGEEVARSRSRDTAHDLCSRVRQIASGRFGVTAEYLAAGDEVQIKIAQGAKPGEGGQLPAHKVTPYIASVRHTKEHVSLISPPPHHDIYSIEDLAQLIYDIKKLKKGLKVSVKLVAQAGIGTVAVGVVKAGADGICISGHDGGTGAAPLSSIYHVGLPWEIGLVEVHQALIANAMRHKVTLQCDGQIQSGKDIVTAFMLGADSVAFGTSLLVVMGCVLCRQCFKGMCPVGICTQEEKLRGKFVANPAHVENYLTFLAQETRTYLAALGVASVNELIGQAHLFEMNENLLPAKAKKLDMSGLFQHMPYTRRHKEAHPIKVAAWEESFYEAARSALAHKKALIVEQNVRNTDRAIGTNIAGLMALTYEDIPDNFITLHCRGTAGQSFAAFAPTGLTLTLEGNANDYVGKGLCGGRVVIKPHPSLSTSEPQSIMGNVALYGATNGTLYANGKAGERFAVRNSGAHAVVEGVGEHACEYMTGGIVVILGSYGNNFAAGMTGGTVYVHTTAEQMAHKLNPQHLSIAPLNKDDTRQLKALLTAYAETTNSVKAHALLQSFEHSVGEFVKISFAGA